MYERVYWRSDQKRRNCILWWSGTTSVTEALLYRSGAISRMCKVEDGATTTDYEPEEIKRKVSVNATLADC